MNNLRLKNWGIRKIEVRKISVNSKVFLKANPKDQGNNLKC